MGTIHRECHFETPKGQPSPVYKRQGRGTHTPEMDDAPLSLGEEHERKGPLMPRSWRALPYGLKGQILLKAPTHKLHKAQEEQGPHFKPPEGTAKEILAAFTIAMALDDDDVRLRLGDHYNVYRYADGIGVTLPSGWTTFFPLEGQKLPPRAAREAAGDEPSEDDLRGSILVD